MARRKRKQVTTGAAPEPARQDTPLVGTGLGPLLKAALAGAQAQPPTGPGRPPDRTVPPTQPAPGPEPLVPVTVPPAPKVPKPAPKAPKPDPDDEEAGEAAKGGLSAKGRLSAKELRWLNDAYAGAKPLGRARKQVGQAGPQAGATADSPEAGIAAAGPDVTARARLSALVGGGVRFVIDMREDGWVAARRQGVGPSELRRLRGAGFRPEASLDLHGRRRDQVAAEVTQFVRTQYRHGCRYLLLVHGKGLHSEGGHGVLGDAVFEALTGGGAAPVVRALATPHVQHGGRGALAIFLG